MTAQAAETTTLYIRVPAQLKQRVQQVALDTEQLTDTVVRLLQDGLELPRLRSEKSALDAQVQHLNTANSLLQNQADFANSQIAAYRSQIQQLNQWLSVPVAKCKHCQQTATVLQVAANQCPTTRAPQATGFELLDMYKGQQGSLEILRDLSALVGAATMVVAAANVFGQAGSGTSGAARRRTTSSRTTNTTRRS